MAVQRQPQRRAYGIGNALQDLGPQIIIAERSPTIADKPRAGTKWINTLANSYYVTTGPVQGEGVWLNLAGGSGVFDSIVATTGNITANVGDLVALLGDVVIAQGNISAPNGSINAANGTYNQLTVNGPVETTGTFTLDSETDGVLLTDNTGLITATQGTDGQLIIGATGSAPAFANLTSSGMTITITEGANTINLDTAGAAGTTEFEADDLSTAVPVAGVIVMAGASGVTTSAAGDTVTFALDDPLSVVGSITAGTSVSAATTVTAGTGVTVTTGNVAISSGSLTLPTTSSTDGQIILNSNRFVHSYGGASNFFAGSGAGNFTLTGTNLVGVGGLALAAVTTLTSSSGVGYAAATSLETGTATTVVGAFALENATAASQTTAVGHEALHLATSSTANTAVGASALGALLTGTGNTAVGYQAGLNYVSNESNNIVIGNSGVVGDSATCRIGNNSTTKFFVGGVYGVTTDSATTATVLVSDEGQLGTISSSRRYKENIEDMGHYDDNLMKLRPVTFEYKSRPGRREYGLIAEEVNEVYPDLVNLNQEGQPDNVQYFKLSPMMLNQLKKMAARIESLESKASTCSCRN